jgi:hypothetical protein
VTTSDDAFTVYALRCADGTENKHTLPHRTMRNLALIELTRADSTRQCGPHALLSATVSRSPWVVLDDLTPELDRMEQIRTGPLAFECPRCGAQPDHQCANMTARKRGIWSPIRWPHAERIDRGSA